MSNARVTVLLLYVFSAKVISAFLSNRPLSSAKEQFPLLTDEAEKPLLLTPLIDNGNLEEARNLSHVPPLVDDIESYAGFLTVNRTTKSHLYFWFIPRTSANRTFSAPLILWLQGGPGWSSLFGLFAENGPFDATKEGLRRREHAWTNDYHMLYIDQPVGTGFSFTENKTTGYVNTQEQVGEHLYAALVQFYTLFPELREQDLYIAGESYGGKYAPAIAHKVHTANREVSSALKMPLKGIMIGNGYSDPENMLGYGEYLHGLGLIDKHDRVRLERTQEKIRYLIRSEEWELANAQLDQLFDDMHSMTNFTTFYDYTTRDKFEFEHPYVDFVTQNKVRERIHAGPGRYKMISLHVRVLFRMCDLQTVRPWIEELLEHYPMLFYNGQFDIIVAHSLTENFLLNLRWSGASKYAFARQHVWREEGTIAGYYKAADNLVSVIVRNAGHMVPSDQPRNALSLINMFVKRELWNASTVYPN